MDVKIILIIKDTILRGNQLLSSYHTRCFVDMTLVYSVLTTLEVGAIIPILPIRKPEVRNFQVWVTQLGNYGPVCQFWVSL